VNRRGLVAALIASLAVLAAAGAAVWITDRLMGTRPASSAIGGAFTLVDQEGRTVTERDLKGKWQLIYFGYTHCPDACPTALSDMAEALEQLGPKAEQVRPVFISIDPERDTPAAIKDYLASFDPPVLGLTGSKEQVAAAARAFRVYYAKAGEDGPDYAMDHSSIIYLMDPQGRFVANFTHETPPARMAQRLQQLLS
jgi:protein SCO1/2